MTSSTHDINAESENAQQKATNGSATSKEEKCENRNKKIKLRDKIFVERQSLIQEMYDVKHIRNIHYIFIVFLLTICINQIMDGLIHEGSLSLHLDPIIVNFSDGYVALKGWFIFFGFTLLVYPVFYLWQVVHFQMSTETLRKSWDYLWISLIIGYYYKIFAWTGEYIENNELSFTSSFTLTVEATRLVMKTHAFIRSNVGKLLEDQQNFKMASFLHFFEFLFMPTLVYRDSYPRKKSINWKEVLLYSVEICGCVFFVCYLYNMYYDAECNYYKTTNTIQLKEFTWLFLRNTVPCLGIMILMFYLVLHSWQNLFGELTRFADRQFYQDWWNSTSYDEYYRKWNIVVHDWLYNYVYKDVFNAFAAKSPLLPKFMVFLISSIFHEYILYYTMRMFYPVLGTIFLTCAMIFTSFRSPKYWLFNVLFLYGYALGFSITITAYITEYCVRQNPCAVNSTKIPFDWLYSKSFFNDCGN